MTMNKCWSTDGEYFYSHFPDDLEVGQVYYEADRTDIVAEDYIHVNDILEEIDNQIYDDVGEVYDCDFYNVSKEAKGELKQLITDWANKHVNLKYYIVGKSKELIATEEDVT